MDNDKKMYSLAIPQIADIKYKCVHPDCRKKINIGDTYFEVVGYGSMCLKHILISITGEYMYKETKDYINLDS